MTAAVRLPPVLLTALVLHLAVASQLRLFGVAADLLLVVSVAAGMAAGAERGAVVAFAAGLLADCFLQTPFGLSALVFAVAAWAAGAFHATVLPGGRWVPVLVGAVACGLGVVLFAVAGTALGGSHLLTGRLPLIAAVVGATGGLLTPPATRVLRWALVPRRPTTLVLR